MTKDAQGHLAMMLFSALVAGSFATGRLIANEIEPIALTAIRFTLAALMMTGFCAITGRLDRSQLQAPWRYFALGAAMSIYFVLMFEGLKTATAVSSSAVFTLTPAMSAFFGWILLRQVTTPWMALALAVGAAGALWVIFKGDLAALIAFDIGHGEFIFFFGCLAHAIYAPLIPKLNRGEPTLVFTAGMLIAGSLILLVLGARDIAATPWAGFSGTTYLIFAYLAFMTTALTFWLVQFAAMRLPASKVMAYTYLTPSFVMVWEAVMGFGLPPLGVIFGVGLTALALVMLLRK